jgi:hypothetical protein
MCEFIYGRFAHPDVRQQHLDVDFITEHFPEAMVICKHHDLVKLVTLEQDYSDELVMQLYSTVHFHEDDAKTMIWMSGGKQYTHTLAQSSALLGYEVKDPCDLGYRRIHSPKNSYHFDMYLYVCYPPGDGELYAPYIVHMTNTYHTIHKSLHHIIVINQGDKGMVRID